MPLHLLALAFTSVWVHSPELSAPTEKVGACRGWQQHLPLNKPFIAGNIFLVECRTSGGGWAAGNCSKVGQWLSSLSALVGVCRASHAWWWF